MILGLKGAFQGAKTDEERKIKFNEWTQSVIDYFQYGWSLSIIFVCSWVGAAK